eukprot:1160894-Pelagomonas_calceolata.AAC.20
MEKRWKAYASQKAVCLERGDSIFGTMAACKADISRMAICSTLTAAACKEQTAWGSSNKRGVTTAACPICMVILSTSGNQARCLGGASTA